MSKETMSPNDYYQWAEKLVDMFPDGVPVEAVLQTADDHKAFIDVNADELLTIVRAYESTNPSPTEPVTSRDLAEILSGIIDEVRPEITRVNDAAGETIFNPTATMMVEEGQKLLSRYLEESGEEVK